MTASAVCFSHATGALGEEVAHAVADSLGYRYVDEEVLLVAAEREGLEPEQLAALERRRTGLARFQIDIVTGGMVDEILRSAIRDAIRDAAATEKVVIVAHAASLALADYESVLRVLITGSRDARARRLAQAEQVDEREAARRIDSSDKGRAAYLKRFYGVERELPIHYDLIINTDRLRVETAAGLVVGAVAR